MCSSYTTPQNRERDTCTTRKGKRVSVLPVQRAGYSGRKTHPGAGENYYRGTSIQKTPLGQQQVSLE